jgi:hypothetical protein
MISEAQATNLALEKGLQPLLALDEGQPGNVFAYRPSGLSAIRAAWQRALGLTFG